MNKNVYNIIILVIAIIMFGLFAFSALNNDKKEKINEDFELIVITSGTTTEIQHVSQNTTKITCLTDSTTVEVTSTLTEISSETTVTTEPITFPININTANIYELMALEGIGETIATAIIEYREQNGHFINRDELLNVQGIGEAKLLAIWDYIFVENEIWEVYIETDTEYNYYEEEIVDTEVYTEIAESETTITTEPIIVNLNTATKEEFMMLPYVTEEIAEDIINLREQIQYFSHPYELLLVESLTQKQVAEIIKYVII